MKKQLISLLLILCLALSPLWAIGCGGEAECDHDSLTYTKVTDPTCSAEGKEEAKCPVCEQTVSRPIAKLPHTFDAHTTCTVCGFSPMNADVPEKSLMTATVSDLSVSLGLPGSPALSVTAAEDPKIVFDTEAKSFYLTATLKSGEKTTKITGLFRDGAFCIAMDDGEGTTYEVTPISSLLGDLTGNLPIDISSDDAPKKIEALQKYLKDNYAEAGKALSYVLYEHLLTVAPTDNGFTVTFDSVRLANILGDILTGSTLGEILTKYYDEATVTSLKALVTKIWNTPVKDVKALAEIFGLTEELTGLLSSFGEMAPKDDDALLPLLLAPMQITDPWAFLSALNIGMLGDALPGATEMATIKGMVTNVIKAFSFSYTTDNAGALVSADVALKDASVSIPAGDSAYNIAASFKIHVANETDKSLTELPEDVAALASYLTLPAMPESFEADYHTKYEDGKVTSDTWQDIFMELREEISYYFRSETVLEAPYDLSAVSGITITKDSETGILEYMIAFNGTGRELMLEVQKDKSSVVIGSQELNSYETDGSFFLHFLYDPATGNVSAIPEED